MKEITIDGKEYVLDFERAIYQSILKPKFYTRIGTVWTHSQSVKPGLGNTYLLCSTSSNCVALVNMYSGNRFRDHKTVVNPYNITQEEWDKISRSDWHDHEWTQVEFPANLVLLRK